MATDAGFVDYVMEQAGLGARLSCRRMFGEYALYIDGKVVAFACDDSLFIKPNAEVARLHPHLPQRPPYPGAKDYPVADELLDDGDALRALLIACERVLPAPKPATKKKHAQKAAKPVAKPVAKPSPRKPPR